MLQFPSCWMGKFWNVPPWNRAAATVLRPGIDRATRRYGDELHSAQNNPQRQTEDRAITGIGSARRCRPVEVAVLGLS